MFQKNLNLKWGWQTGTSVNRLNVFLRSRICTGDNNLAVLGNIFYARNKFCSCICKPRWGSVHWIMKNLSFWIKIQLIPESRNVICVLKAMDVALMRMNNAFFFSPQRTFMSYSWNCKFLIVKRCVLLCGFDCLFSDECEIKTVYIYNQMSFLSSLQWNDIVPWK